MVVVDVAAVTSIAAAAENISSVAEEADGKMMEIATHWESNLPPRGTFLCPGVTFLCPGVTFL